jgi:hypothetical protein
MTLLHIDGFELGDGLIRYNQTSSLAPTTSSTRFGYGLAFAPDSSRSLGKNFPATSTIVVGAAVKVVTGTSYFTFYGDNGTTQHITISMVKSGNINVRRGDTGGTILGGSYATPNNWFYLEVKLTIGDGTSGSVIVKVNEVEVINTGGVDTKNGGTNTSVDSARIGCSGSSSGTFDDFYILNTAGATNNNFLGDVRVVTLMPSGNGNSSQLTGSDGNSTDNYLLVDENPYSSADYVQSNTTTQKDTYTLQDLPAGANQVFGVQEVAVARKDDAGYRGLKHVIRRGGTDYASTEKTLSSGETVYLNLRETDPSTSVAWVVADVNSMEGGVQII